MMATAVASCASLGLSPPGRRWRSPAISCASLSLSPPGCRWRSPAISCASLSLSPPGRRWRSPAISRTCCLAVQAEAAPPGVAGGKVLDDSVIEPRGVRDFVEQSRDLIRPDGGPPRWFSPLEAGFRHQDSPLLLFLPGIDGAGFGLIRHHQRLGKIFDIWCLHIPVRDRTPFEGLVEYVEKTVKSEKSCLLNKPIYLVGESLGACLALAVAARNPNIDFILILANPGTSFCNSQLESFSSLLRIVLEPLHVTVPDFLSFLAGNSMKMASTYLENILSLQQTVSGASETLTDMLATISFLADILPKETLQWKLKMLRSASLYVNSRLHSVKAQTLVVASGKDQLLPSSEEAERICRAIPDCRIRHVQNGGHFILLDGDFDLVTTIKGACYYRRSRHKDYVSDYLLPTRKEFHKAVEQYRWVDLTASPAMFSTLKNGKIVKGLAGIPLEGPAVFVGYHMLMGFELGHLVSRFMSDKNIHLRGIGHPFLFNKEAEQLMLDSASFDGHRIMGAVPVTAANFYKLLSQKSFVLLYPGGAREALHKKGEQYKLFWPEQSEFVRMASRFGASIIPFGVVGEDDICDVMLDYDDLANFPFYDIMSKRLNQDAMRVRADSSEEVGKQVLHIPGILPKFPGRIYFLFGKPIVKFPGRIYFLFGKPIETKGRRVELRDREQAYKMYIEVRSEVENCIAYLKEKREEDPYRNLLSRLIYQATSGFTADVPTFEP